jgi:hypothetical protein
VMMSFTNPNSLISMKERAFDSTRSTIDVIQKP